LKIEDKRLELVSRIQLSSTKVLLQPPIIFLCGGLVKIEELENHSVRDALMEHLAVTDSTLSEHITVAEDYKDWLHDGLYADLLEFEDDIAHIASLIVIILESAGSIAELGAFAVNDVLNKKLQVFICDDHYEQDSFIKLGPLRYLDSIREGSVSAYPWDQNNPNETIKPSLADITTDIDDFVADLSSTEAFSKENSGHLAFIIFELISVFQALKFTEITEYLNKIEIKVLRDKVKKMLFLLSKFDFISVKRRGKVEYYYPTKNDKRLRIGGTFDRVAAKMSAMQFYATNEKESKRLSVIKEFVLVPVDVKEKVA